MLTVFLPLSDISVPTDHSLHAPFLPSDVWNKCQIDVTSGSSAILKISSTVEAWSYDKSGYIISGYKNGYIISDTSFKVDDTVFDWTFNINFTGVEVCIGSYKVSFSEFWFLVFFRKKILIIIGSLYSTIIGGFNSVFNNLFQRIDNRFEVSLQCDILLHFINLYIIVLQSLNPFLYPSVSILSFSITRNLYFCC